MSGTEADEGTGVEDGAQEAAELIAQHLRWHAEANELEELFRYLLAEIQASHVTLVEALDVAGTWDAIDDLAERHPEYFVGWFDWCANPTLQQTLLSSPRVSAVVAGERQKHYDSQRVDDGSGGYVEADLNSPLSASQQWAQPAAERLLAGDLPGMFAALDSIGTTEMEYAVNGLTTTRQWTQALEGAVRSDPDGFLGALNAARPATRDALAASNGSVDVLLRTRRRARRWQPTSEQLGFVRGQNQINVKNLDNGGSTTWVVGGLVVLIGGGHDEEIVQRVRAETDQASGEVTVRKGGVFGAGTLTFSGCTSAKQGLVRSAVESFSDKSVRFV